MWAWERYHTVPYFTFFSQIAMCKSGDNKQQCPSCICAHLSDEFIKAAQSNVVAAPLWSANPYAYLACFSTCLHYCCLCLFVITGAVEERLMQRHAASVPIPLQLLRYAITALTTSLDMHTPASLIVRVNLKMQRKEFAAHTSFLLASV